jgi:hypothetical protein
VTQVRHMFKKQGWQLTNEGVMINDWKLMIEGCGCCSFRVRTIFISLQLQKSDEKETCAASTKAHSVFTRLEAASATFLSSSLCDGVVVFARWTSLTASLARRVCVASSGLCSGFALQSQTLPQFPEPIYVSGMSTSAAARAHQRVPPPRTGASR